MTTTCAACGRPLDTAYALPAQPPHSGLVCVDTWGCFRAYLTQPVPVVVALRPGRVAA